MAVYKFKCEVCELKRNQRPSQIIGYHKNTKRDKDHVETDELGTARRSHTLPEMGRKQQTVGKFWEQFFQKSGSIGLREPP
jgi:hypothetical protein